MRGKIIGWGLLFGLLIATSVTAAVPFAEPSGGVIEERGTMQTLNVQAGTVVVNHRTYRLHSEFEVVQEAEDGLLLYISPEQIPQAARVGLEKRDGQVTRIHLLQ